MSFVNEVSFNQTAWSTPPLFSEIRHISKDSISFG